MRILLQVLAAAVLIVAPHSAFAAAEPLAGSAWRPVPLSGLAGSAERPVFVKFAGAEKVSGFAGCNTFTGSYRQKGDKLILGPLATTRKLCAPDVMERETWFLKALKRVRKVETTARELALKELVGAVFLRLERHE